MSADFTRRLIEEVKARPALYDRGNADFKNVKIRNQVWQELADTLEVDCFSLKNRWRSLRDCYGKYNKAVNGISNGKYINWPWGEQLSFLGSDPIYKTRKQFKAELSSVSIADFTSPTVLDSKRKRDTVPESRNSFPYMGLVTENRSGQKTDLDLLFMSYAIQCAKFSPMTQAKLKLGIAELFARVEMETEERRTCENAFDDCEVANTIELTSSINDEGRIVCTIVDTPCSSSFD